MTKQALVEPGTIAPLADQASPDMYAELVNTGTTRLVRMVMPPGATDAPHRHPEEIVYFVRGGSLSIRLEDGSTAEKEVADGEVMHNGPWTHQVTNAGESEVEAIIFERLDNDVEGFQHG
ncbi:cupin domain-containing protein [Qipengyuania flava]|uniref:cupin domain-containing protein n=1 Tax=Qipengyuania flava TaxID=192812 RepID=UPI001ADC0165|nr:cupin domain-containing protein [Qipengyuania flava]MBO9505483.1 cupin domain-containing protein [Qipengyuania flava]